MVDMEAYKFSSTIGQDPNRCNLINTSRRNYVYAFIIHNRYLKVVNVGTLTLASILGLLLQMYLY